MEHISYKINRNMRCIEIGKDRERNRKQFWINRNMRCIEIHRHCMGSIRQTGINRNMRCIEIDIVAPAPPCPTRLIET